MRLNVTVNRYMEKTPFISIIIPTFNSTKFIAAALESVRAQSYENFEVIFSDDGSVDGTPEFIRQWCRRHPMIHSRIVQHPHCGPAANRNKGILEAGGEWIAFLDSDDIWYECKLKRVVESINQNPGVDIWCHSEIMDSKNEKTLLEHYRKFNPRIPAFLSLYRENALSTSAVTVRKDCLIKAGLFDEDINLSPSEDYDLWLRLAKTVSIGFIREVLGVYVIRDGNISADPSKLLNALFYIARKHRQGLKLYSPFCHIGEIRFRARALTASGRGFINQGRFVRGMLFISAGILLWPFRFGFFRRFFKRLMKKFF